MNKQFYKILSPILISSLIAVSAHAEEFNFAYKSVGQDQLRPIQTFDDGVKTYLQLKSTIIPVVVVDVAGVSTMLSVRRSGQYLVVPAITHEMTLKFSSLSARVIFNGGSRSTTKLAPDAVQQVSSFDEKISAGAKKQQPIFARAAYSAVKPLTGDNNVINFTHRDSLIPFSKDSATLTKLNASKIVSELAGNGEVFEVIITGRDDKYYTEGLAKSRAIAMRERVLATGISPEKITIKEGVSVDQDSKFIFSELTVIRKNIEKPDYAGNIIIPARNVWDMNISDINVSTMFTRWANSEGWSLVWKNQNDVLISGNANINANSLVDAVNVVIKSSNKIGFSFNVETDKKLIIIK